MVVHLHLGQGTGDLVETLGGVEATDDRKIERSAEADQHPTGVDDDPTGRTGQPERIDRWPRVQGESPGYRSVPTDHGRPIRVAVISWLRPPESGRWFTEENPAARNIDRSSVVGGR